jgi:hypothetical protein
VRGETESEITAAQDQVLRTKHHAKTYIKDKGREQIQTMSTIG